MLVAASSHRGEYQTAVRRFATDGRDALARRPTGFFQVSTSSADGEKSAEAVGYVDEFVEATGRRPDRIGLFGGALRFSEYGFPTRALMRRIGRAAVPAEPVTEPSPGSGRDR